MENGSVAQRSTGSCESFCTCVYQQRLRRLCLMPQTVGSSWLPPVLLRLSWIFCLPVLFQLSILQEQPRKDAGDISYSPLSTCSSSSMLTPTSAGLLDPSTSCPGTPSAQHSKMAALQGVGCPSPVATLKRPTALSRHTSAAGLHQTHSEMSFKCGLEPNGK